MHGEDWGSLVATHLANLFPNRVGGIQLTLPIAFGAEFGSIFDLFTFLIGQIMPNTFFTEDEIAMNFSQRYSISNRLWTMWFSFGYMHLQVILFCNICKVNFSKTKFETLLRQHFQTH